MYDATWSLKVSGHVLLSAAWHELVVLGRGRVPAVQRGLSSSSAPRSVSRAAVVGWLPLYPLRWGCTPVTQTISVTVTAPLVSSAQTPCDGTLQRFSRLRMAVPRALQPASVQQSSAAQASLFSSYGKLLT